jgi:hypothetical protein
MSYDYAARVVFVGRLASTPHPALYDLCAVHAENLRVPLGWATRSEPWVVAAAPAR